jgi:Leucine-rich repeat (LRR) protein
LLGLKGTIPTEIGQFGQLSSLGLHNNLVNGTIPTELGALADLTELYLMRNQLTGTIPSEIGKLKQLQTFRVQDNGLSGHLPDLPYTQCTSCGFDGLSGNPIEHNKFSCPLPEDMPSRCQVKCE